MNWNEFLKRDEFRAYRKRQVEVAGVYIERYCKAAITGNTPDVSSIKMHGAMEMAKAFIDLPESMTEDEGLQEQLSIQKKEDYAALAKFLVMRQML